MEMTALQEKLNKKPNVAMTNLQSATKQLEKNKMNFLKLFTTQMTHQNPLSPMDSGEMYNNIAQLNLLEQQLEGNKLLTLIRDDLKSQTFNGAYNNMLLGEVRADLAAIKSSMMGIDEGDNGLVMKDGVVKMPYTVLQDDIVGAKIVVENEHGMALMESTVDPSQGLHHFNWNGIDRNGNKVSDVSKVRYRVMLIREDGSHLSAVTPLGTNDAKADKLKAYADIIEKLAKNLHESQQQWFDGSA
ncbi:MAG: hypothetical protein JSS50_01155 [Proteobacteria bacterium]|nr:hypothetical protein [Pseudomonadota bacterium]